MQKNDKLSKMGNFVGFLYTFTINSVITVARNIPICFTVKSVLSSHSKLDKTKVLKTNGGLMKVESIAECALGAFCNTFDLY